MICSLIKLALVCTHVFIVTPLSSFEPFKSLTLDKVRYHTRFCFHNVVSRGVAKLSYDVLHVFSIAQVPENLVDEVLKVVARIVHGAFRVFDYQVGFSIACLSKSTRNSQYMRVNRSIVSIGQSVAECSTGSNSGHFDLCK